MNEEKREEVLALGECKVSITRGGSLAIDCKEPVKDLEIHDQGVRMLSFLSDLAVKLPEEKPPKPSK